MVGFVVEICNVEEYVVGKLVVKKFDMIVCNDVLCFDIGFVFDENVMMVFFVESYKMDKCDLEKVLK